ncbi:MAG TPA: ATP-binding cassette domain-containing protein [Ignavibacteriaceae bacterium]|jgi:ABC-2 type transport system ATP-binding protein|nr:ATP-binding cassette domain-containing protein [Ignavibacteriaceae bacterium]
MLTVQNLRKEFNNVVAVEDISFNIDEGKIFGILGPNGAGKTTTLRTILNIIKPTSGTISFDSKPITDEFFNLIGYLPEEKGLYRKSKVIDIILYFAQLKNIPKPKAKESADYWLKKMEIPHYKNKRIDELSKGNQQKVQFITAVIHEPKLLILDEPFSGFDPINQQILKEMILNFVDSGKIIVLSTHQMETAEKLCSEILLINKGKEVCSGSISQVKKRYGKNHIKIEFEGDGSFLNSLPFVNHIDNYKNYAEIELSETTAPHEFLKEVVYKINITQFSVIEPTLNQIFIDVIKQSKN